MKILAGMLVIQAVAFVLAACATGVILFAWSRVRRPGGLTAGRLAPRLVLGSAAIGVSAPFWVLWALIGVDDPSGADGVLGVLVIATNAILAATIGALAAGRWLERSTLGKMWYRSPGLAAIVLCSGLATIGIVVADAFTRESRASLVNWLGLLVGCGLATFSIANWPLRGGFFGRERSPAL